MKNFIKNLNSLEMQAVRFIKTSFNVTFVAAFTSVEVKPHMLISVTAINKILIVFFILLFLPCFLFLKQLLLF